MSTSQSFDNMLPATSTSGAVLSVKLKSSPVLYLLYFDIYSIIIIYTTIIIVKLCLYLNALLQYRYSKLCYCNLKPFLAASHFLQLQ